MTTGQVITLLRALCYDLAKRGAAYAVIVRNAAGEIENVAILPADKIAKFVTADDKQPAPPAAAYQYIVNGEPIVTFTADEVIALEAPIPAGKHYPLSADEVDTLVKIAALVKERV